MQYWQRKLQRSVTEMRTSPIERPWPSTSCSRSMEITLPARLVQQLDPLDDHAGLDPLDHVVDRERANTARDHRLHLDPGPRARARFGDERDGAGLDIHADRRLDVRERQRVR